MEIPAHRFCLLAVPNLMRMGTLDSASMMQIAAEVLVEGWKIGNNNSIQALEVLVASLRKQGSLN